MTETNAEKRERRVQKIIGLVEETLGEIANEYENPLTRAPAMLDFFTELQRRLLRVGNARVRAFLTRRSRDDG